VSTHPAKLAGQLAVRSTGAQHTVADFQRTVNTRQAVPHGNSACLRLIWAAGAPTTAPWSPRPCAPWGAPMRSCPGLRTISVASRTARSPRRPSPMRAGVRPWARPRTRGGVRPLAGPTRAHAGRLRGVHSW